MDEFRLKAFFYGLLELSYTDLRPGWGNPCSQLLKDMCTRQKPFIDRILGDYTGDSHEYRLNEAGLKMHWRIVQISATSRESGFKCHISGDQACEYPIFVSRAKELIKKYGYKRQR